MTSKKTTAKKENLQKNRQRANQQQLMVLQEEYNRCPIPDVFLREKIGKSINMTERSVQIWFQNARAKDKKNKIEQKPMGLTFPWNEINDDSNLSEIKEPFSNIPQMQEEEMFLLSPQSPLTPQIAQTIIQARPSFFPTSVKDTFDFNNHHQLNFPDESNMTLNTNSCQSIFFLEDPYILPLTVFSITIGLWKCVQNLPYDIVINFHQKDDFIEYLFHVAQMEFRILLYLNQVVNLDFYSLSNYQTQLIVQLSTTPSFSFRNNKLSSWIDCQDFTKDNQASLMLTHIISGITKAEIDTLYKIRSELGHEPLVSTESYVQVNQSEEPIQMHFVPNMDSSSQINDPLDYFDLTSYSFEGYEYL